MALATYRTRTARLLQNPAAPTPLYAQALVDDAINQARGQIAGEAECIRRIGTISATVDQRAYDFSAISLGTASVTGVGGVIHARRLTYDVGDGQQLVYNYPWEWFDLYCMNNPVPTAAAPTSWAQYAQGAANVASSSLTISGAGGSFYVDPPPDLTYTFNLDCVCYPIALTDDNTVEAIPYLWTDAVPFLAAYWVLMSAQTQARYNDAQRLYTQYETFTQRARTGANSSVNRPQYEQAVDPSQINKLGIVNRTSETRGR